MAVTDAPTAPETGDDRGADRAEGRLTRWLRDDPVRAVAIALIVLQLAWRPQIASRGYLAFDDFNLAARTAESGLSFEFLFQLYNNHLMPGGILTTWLVTRAAGLAYWPYVVLMILAQAAVSIAFYRLLRQLLRPGWALLVPLAVFLFTPLTLEVTSWWAVGVNLLPMQLAMVLAIGAQVRYVRTRRPRHLVALCLSVLLGLLFFEKALLIVPLVFLVVACLLVDGGPVRSVVTAARRYWPSWAVLAGLTIAYLVVYLSRSESSLHKPATVSEALTFLRQLIGSTLVPGLVGGPWQWITTGGGAAITAPEDIPRWLSWAVLAGLVVVTILLRRRALRGWALLLGYLVLVAALLTVTRLGLSFSAAAGLAPRYVADVVVVAALCIGVALAGVRDTPDGVADPPPARPAAWPPALWNRATVAISMAVVLVMLLISAAWSTERFGEDWANKPGREFIRTVRADLAKVPQGTVFLDRAVPETVQSRLTWPYNLQSKLLRPLSPRPKFVTEAENPWMIDDAGHTWPARVAGQSAKPGPDGDCGYKLSAGQPVRMPLTRDVDVWQHAVRINYLGSGDSFALFRFGEATHWFKVSKGIHTIVFLVVGGGDTVELTVQDPAVVLCTNDVSVGVLVPHV